MILVCTLVDLSAKNWFPSDTICARVDSGKLPFGVARELRDFEKSTLS